MSDCKRSVNIRRLIAAVKRAYEVVKTDRQNGGIFPPEFLIGLRWALESGLSCEEIVSWLVLVTGLHEVQKRGLRGSELVLRTVELVRVMTGDLGGEVEDLFDFEIARRKRKNRRRKMGKLRALELTELSGELYDQIEEAVDAIRLKIVEAFADGNVTFREVLGVVGDMVREFVALVASLGEMTPAEKKAAVLELVDEVYEKDVRPLDMTFVPDWIEDAYVDPLVGQIVHTAAEKILDMLIPE